MGSEDVFLIDPHLIRYEIHVLHADDPDVFRSIETYLKVKAESERLLFTQKAVIQCGLRDVRAVSCVRENIIRSSRLDLECLESH